MASNVSYNKTTPLGIYIYITYPRNLTLRCANSFNSYDHILIKYSKSSFRKNYKHFLQKKLLFTLRTFLPFTFAHLTTRTTTTQQEVLLSSFAIDCFSQYIF